MPSAEARLKKNRCANCFDCPSCGHTLSTRATSMTIAAPLSEGEAQPSKVLKFYISFSSTLTYEKNALAPRK